MALTYLLTYLFTYLFTPWCWVLPEKLTGLQLVKKFPAFHGTRMFITALTSVRLLSLSWASPIQSIYPHPTFWRSIVILSTLLRLGLPCGLLPSGFPSKTLYTPSPHPYAPHAHIISFFSILSPAQYWVRSTWHLQPKFKYHLPPCLSVILSPLRRTLFFLWQRTAAFRCLLFPFVSCMWTLHTLCYLYSDCFETVIFFVKIVFRSAHIYKDVTPDWTEEQSLSREDS